MDLGVVCGSEGWTTKPGVCGVDVFGENGAGPCFIGVETSFAWIGDSAAAPLAAGRFSLYGLWFGVDMVRVRAGVVCRAGVFGDGLAAGETTVTDSIEARGPPRLFTGDLATSPFLVLVRLTDELLFGLPAADGAGPLPLRPVPFTPTPDMLCMDVVRMLRMDPATDGVRREPFAPGRPFAVTGGGRVEDIASSEALPANEEGGPGVLRGA